jgi:hypothetical protein
MSAGFSPCFLQPLKIAAQTTSFCKLLIQTLESRKINAQLMPQTLSLNLLILYELFLNRERDPTLTFL